jgi:uncharacterized protein (TIGR02996 family)
MAKRRKHSTENAFREAILEDPDDDTPRLVYADWLQEHGDSERGEFIRVQVELARLPPGDERRSGLLAREGRLFLLNRDRWTIQGLRRPHFHRGFIDEWNFGWPPDEAFRQAPIQTVWHVVYDEWYPDEADEPQYPVNSPHLARVRTAHLPAGRSNTIPTDLLLGFTECPHLTDLRSLDVSGNNDMGDEGLSQLVGSGPTSRRSARATPPGLLRLETLNVSETGLGDEAVEALVDSPVARTLTRLDLSENPRITSAGVRALFGSDLGGRLTELHLSEVGRSQDAVVAALVKALPQTALRRLKVGKCFRTVRQIERLANAASWGTLQGLDLSFAPLSGDGLRALMKCPHLAGLSHLSLDYCGLKDGDVKVLAKCPHLQGLTHLSLISNNIGDVGAKALAASPHLRRLVYLNLGNHASTFGDTGLTALAESPLLARLCCLDLKGSMECTFGDRCLEALAKSPYVGRLTTLRVGVTTATDAGVKALAESPNLPCLTYLDLRTPHLTAGGLDALLRARHIAWLAVRWPGTWRLPKAVPAAEKSRIGPASIGSGFGDTDIRWEEPFFDWWDQRWFF